MKKQFVTYEISLMLKELGFDEPCLTWFNIKGGLVEHSAFSNGDVCYPRNSNFGSNGLITAPLWQQVIDWFREKHELEISIISWENNIIPNRSESISYVLYSGIKFKYNIYKYNPWHIYNSDYTFNNYEEAREQVILNAIELCQKEK